MADRVRTCLQDRRSSFALEFAMVGPVFMVFLFVIFEVSYDEFLQEVLDNALQSSARQVQIGNTQGATSATFVNRYFCQYGIGLLNCNNLFVQIQQISFSSSSCPNSSSPAQPSDFYEATANNGPSVSSGQLQLGAHFSGAGTAGSGGSDNHSPCATAGSISGYCNAGPQEFILMNAVYAAPSFVGALMPNHVTYNGNYVRPIYSSVAFVTETFSSSSPSNAC